MNLIPPRERTTLFEQEREKLVKEETRIAHGIDELREQKLNEEKRLADFREKEFKKYQEDIAAQKEELASLDALIAIKKKEMEAYFGPLDKQWALYKRVEKKKIEDKQLELDAEVARVATKEQKLAERDQKLEEKALQVEQKRVEALRIEEQSRRHLADAQKESERLLKDAEKLYHDAESDRESALKIKDEAKAILRQAEEYKTTLDLREKELEDRETKVLIAELKYYSPIKQNNVLPNSTAAIGR